MIAYSVVVPVYNEQKSLAILHKEITSTLESLGKPFEVIYVDDGSTDKSFKKLSEIKKSDKSVSLIRFRANFGKSAALAAAFRASSGLVIITLDADLQDDPADIPALVNKLAKGYDFVTGWRKKRVDTFLKRLSSKLFNIGTSVISRVSLHDFNCGLRVMRRQVADEIALYGELHRFFPILAAKAKFRITEIPVHNRPRRFGMSKYGLERSWRGVVDLLTTMFLTGYASKPAHFFGKIGLIFFVAGFLMDAYVAYLRISTGSTQEKIPMLLAGILSMVLGVQLLSTGLIAEMIIHYNSKRNIRETTQ